MFFFNTFGMILAHGIVPSQQKSAMLKQNVSGYKSKGQIRLWAIHGLAAPPPTTMAASTATTLIWDAPTSLGMDDCCFPPAQ
jgi:hypothetical protein